jgi:2-polyprenyl-3-methyl-5-hydroxy-6-metoxy-1,4-benzoquinol methylase
MTRATPGAHALGAYAGAPRADRIHVRVRWRSCPFPEVAARVPTSGRILDLGCGHGLFSLYLALSEPGRQVTGIDVDADKLAVARAAAARVGASVSFAAVEEGHLPAGAWDAVTIVDVLYLMGRDRALEVLQVAAAALAPGGLLIVKEVDVHPRWKYRLTRWQELAATKVLRITEGAEVVFMPPSDIGAAMEAAGLEVHHEPLDRGRLHPHHLVIGKRPAAPGQVAS